MRRAIQILFVLAIPGLVFGFLLRTTTPPDCEVDGGLQLLNTFRRPLCEPMNPAILYGLIVALVVFVIGWGLRSASRPDRSTSP